MGWWFYDVIVYIFYYDNTTNKVMHKALTDFHIIKVEYFM